jgi:hypothetical protein
VVASDSFAVGESLKKSALGGRGSCHDQLENTHLRSASSDANRSFQHHRLACHLLSHGKAGRTGYAVSEDCRKALVKYMINQIGLGLSMLHIEALRLVHPRTEDSSGINRQTPDASTFHKATGILGCQDY